MKTKTLEFKVSPLQDYIHKTLIIMYVTVHYIHYVCNTYCPESYTAIKLEFDVKYND
jgi:hypothetical protein